MIFVVDDDERFEIRCCFCSNAPGMIEKPYRTDEILARVRIALRSRP